MLKLTRTKKEVNGKEVDIITFNGKELTINPQSSKVNKDGSKGQPVVKIEGLEGSNGAKWLSLSKIHLGTNEYEVKGATRQPSQKKSKSEFQEVTYVLTDKEIIQVSNLDKQILELQSKIEKLVTDKNDIVDNAKTRFIPKPDTSDETLASLSPEELVQRINELKTYQSQFPKK